MTTVFGAIASTAQQVWALRAHLTAVAAGLWASYLLHQVLARLDRRGRESIGRKITSLAVVLFAMLLAAHAAWNNVDVTYGAAAIVLLIGGSVIYFWSQWMRTSEPEVQAQPRTPRIPRASAFLLQGGVCAHER